MTTKTPIQLSEVFGKVEDALATIIEGKTVHSKKNLHNALYSLCFDNRLFDLDLKIAQASLAGDATKAQELENKRRLLLEASIVTALSDSQGLQSANVTLTTTNRIDDPLPEKEEHQTIDGGVQTHTIKPESQDNYEYNVRAFPCKDFMPVTKKAIENELKTHYSHWKPEQAEKAIRHALDQLHEIGHYSFYSYRGPVWFTAKKKEASNIFMDEKLFNEFMRRAHGINATIDLFKKPPFEDDNDTLTAEDFELVAEDEFGKTFKVKRSGTISDTLLLNIFFDTYPEENEK